MSLNWTEMGSWSIKVGGTGIGDIFTVPEVWALIEDRKELYVADPVTTPGSAGLHLTVFTLNLFPLGFIGPNNSISTICHSVRLK